MKKGTAQPTLRIMRKNKSLFSVTNLGVGVVYYAMIVNSQSPLFVLDSRLTSVNLIGEN